VKTSIRKYEHFHIAVFFTLILAVFFKFEIDTSVPIRLLLPTRRMIGGDDPFYLKF